MRRPQSALVLGGASCVWDDVEALEALYGQPWDGVVVAANDIGAHWPRDLHHWVSLHPAHFTRWRALRVQSGRWATECVTWSQTPRWLHEVQLTDHVLDPWGEGSSGMLATQVAHVLGCTRVVLCGIPMTPIAHFAETQEHFAPRWHQAAGHWRAWLRHREKFMVWAKSMSGRTQELLGAPTLDWLLKE